MPREKEDKGNDSDTTPTIIYEDESVMVIDKPIGWLVHSDGFNVTVSTVVEWFLKRVPEARGVGEAGYSTQGDILDRSGVVHRLDRETSGVLILAKTQSAHAWLKQQFQNRLAYKEYRAFVYGRINDRWGTINRPLGRSAKDPRRRSAERGAKGVLREAITEFERLAMGEYQGEAFSYLKLMPKTGRTHQLRAHLRALDRPIVGDTLYGEHKFKSSNNLDFTRLALHAYQLDITLPTGNKQSFTAPLPAQFSTATTLIAE